MPKRRHDNVSDDLDESIPLQAARKKTRWNAEVADQMGENGVPDKIEYWIVRKPKTLDISRLPTNFRCPKNFPAAESTIPLPDREDENLNVKFIEPAKQMFYINRENITTSSSNKKRVAPTAEIRGMIFMEREADISDLGPCPPEEDFLIPENCTEPSDFPFQITSIRTAPSVGTYEPTERLKAFGAEIKKKKEAKIKEKKKTEDKEKKKKKSKRTSSESC